MENVRGLAYADAMPTLANAMSLVSDRYNVLGPRIFDAADFGAATRRRRLFVIGMRKDCAPALPIALMEARKKKPATVAQAIGDLELAEPVEDIDGFDHWKIVSQVCPNPYSARL